MTPSELLAMRNVNKAFRSLLSEGNGITIWAKSRDYHGIPKPFEGFTERTWAYFIFSRICENCGKKDRTCVPDFNLMMCLCAECRKENLDEVLEWDEEYSEECDVEDFDIGPDDTFPHSNWHESRDELKHATMQRQYWWTPYFYGTILPLVRDVKRGKKGAEEELNELEEKGQRRFEHALICNKWRDEAEAEDRRAKIEILTLKFKALGYQDFELSELNNYKILDEFNLPLTEHTWEVMRGSFESSIRDKRRKRLLDDHPDIVNGRRALAREAYLAYASTVTPIETTYLPTIADFDAMCEVRAICEREPDVDVTSADFAGIPALLAMWVTNKRTRLTELADNAAPGKPGRFSLASTIFRCKVEHEVLGRPAMFGGDDAMRHVGDLCDPQVDMELSNIAAKLVVSLGLDADVTTVAEMDRHVARVRCDGRTFHSVPCTTKKTTYVFTWRGCVTHAIEAHLCGNGTVRSWRERDLSSADFVRVSDRVGEQARGPSNDFPHEGSASWVCGKCTNYAGEPQTLQKVTEHINAAHGKTPHDADTILLAPGMFSISRSLRYTGPRETASAAKSRESKPQGTNKLAGKFRCLKCKTAKTRGFGDITAVNNHLREKHKVLKPVRDVDYGFDGVWPIAPVRPPPPNAGTDTREVALLYS
ncbi:hypothetical protein C8R43DRAFT_1137444 [Mycena crocata]|nr:hypothetical protein C8R43DRAFT_1137444 [Mycena crocata]